MKPDRWPGVMRKATAAEYLDVSPSRFMELKIPAIQLDARGDRMWAKEDLDAFIEDRRSVCVLSKVA